MVQRQVNLVSRIELVSGDLGHGACKRLEIVYQRLVDQNVAIDKEKRPFDDPGFP